MSETIDVAAILEQLRSEVRVRRQALDAVADPALSAIERQLQQCSEQLELTRVVSAHWPLEGRSIVARGVALFNKVVRRGLRWYINPIVEQQNGFNDVAVRTLRALIAAYQELQGQVAELKREQAQLAVDTPGGTTPPPPAPLPVTADLQTIVAEQGRAEPPAPLPDLALQAFPPQLAQRQAVNAHWHLGGTTPFERVRALVQRTVRQYLRWLINPIVEQQNAFNAALTASLGIMLAADAELRAELAALRARRQRV